MHQLYKKPVLTAIISFLLAFSQFETTQAQPCTGGTPSFAVDLTGKPDSMWISSAVQRAGLCCGASNPDRCIEFIIKLDTGSAGIILDIYSGAKPSGALYYTIGCTGSYAVGAPICLKAPGPHRITFCKPGSNINQYYIRAIPKPKISPSITVTQACQSKLFLAGLVEDSITWTSVPNNWVYNKYLSDTTKSDTVIVKPTGSFPSSVLYRGCGTALGGCSTGKFCDTVRVHFVKDLAVKINPDDPIICFGDTTAFLNARITGGLKPYKVSWSNGKTDSNIFVGTGTYIVNITDSLKCSTASDTITVDSFTLAIAAHPGNDTSLCANINTIKLNGSISAALGGKWLGTGNFTTSNTQLDAIYTFTNTEKSQGYSTLLLATTGNRGCPPDTQPVTFTFMPMPTPSIVGPDSFCSNSFATYTTNTLTGGSYLWTATGGTISGSDTGKSISVLWGAAGTGSVSVKQTSDFGCDSSISKNIRIMPTPAPVISGPDSICSNRTSTYSITAIAGSTYSWTATGGTISGSNTGSSIKVLWGAAGTGSVTVKQTSDFGCDSSVSKSIRIMPTPAPVISGPDSICSNRTSTYSITAIAGSTYSWTATGGTISGSNTGNSITVLWGAAGTGSVSVKQTSSFGCDSSMSKNIRIMPTPAPVISGPDSICSNRTSTYSITAIAGSTYNWTATGGTISGSNTGNSIKVLWGAAGTGSVTVKQTSDFGCDSSISKNIRIMPTPAPVISGPDSICSNRTSTYSITAIVGSTYSWTANGGTISGSNTGNSINVLWGATGTGSVAVKQTSSFGCDSAVNKSITIMPTPAPVISGPDSICSNRTSTYSITAIAGSSYNWTATGGTISGSNTGSSITVLWGAAGTGSVSVKQTSDFGCDSSISKNIRIMPTPAPVISGPDSICSNRTSTYSITAITGSSYSWTATGGTISGSNTGNSITVLWGAAGTGSVTVKQTSDFGCDSSVSKNIRIMPTPAPVISGPDSICSNRTSTYSITAIAGSTYSWTATGGTISGSNTGSSITVLWGAAGTGSVTVEQTSSFGCDSSISKNIRIMPTPAPVISGPDSICSNRTSTYSITAIAGSSYNWTATGGTISGSNTGNSITVLWGAAGTGSVTVKQTSDFGCDSVVSKNIRIMPTPAPVISGPDSICSNRTSTYSITAIAGSSYSWTATGGIISGSNTGNSITVLWGAAGTGSVTVEQTSSFGCDSSISKSIRIMPTPAPVISGPDSICSNRISTYSITTIAGSTYNWTANGGTISGSKTGNSITVLWGAAGTGSVAVKQTSAFGCDSSISKNIRIMPTPAPVISGVDSICSNRTSTYSITAIAGSSYSWTANGGTISGSNTGNSIKVLWGAAGTGSVSVTQTSGFGCDSSVSKSVQIVPTPAPVISGPDSICSNRTSTYSINAIAGSSYSWTATGGTISGSNTGNSITVLWGAAGTGSVSVKQTSSFGCDSSMSKNIRIMPTPAPVISGPDSICSNRTSTYSITAIAGSSYSWTANGGTISGSNTGNSINVLWGAAGTGSVTVKQTSAFGCDSVVSKTIQIVPTPAPVIAGPDSICSNRTSTYSITAIAGSSYSWTATGGTISGSNTGNSITVLWGAAGTGSVSVKQTSDFGCDSSISKNIRIMPTPAPVISGPDSICSNRTSTYSITAIAGSSYSWTATGGTISGSNTGNSITVLWGAAGTGSVTVKQTSDFGCDSSISKNIRIMPTPAPVISGPDSICSNRTSTYSITAIAGSSYSWTANGGTISRSNTGSSIKVLWGAAGAGSVSVTQTSGFGCDSSVSKSVQIVPTPAPVISGPDSICSNRTSTYSITAIAGSTYSWAATGGTISGSNTGNSITVLWGAAGNGSVTVRQTSSFGCDSSVSKNIRIMPTPAPIISGPDSICSNRTSTYSITAIAGSTYSWTANGGTISGSNTGNSIKVLWGAAGTGSVTVKQTSDFGCDSSISKNIRIMPTPAPVISGPDSICSNRTSTYSITAIVGSTYSWTANGGTISGSNTGNSIKVLWGAAGAGSVSVTQTSAFGCDSSVSKSVQIVPTPAPVISGPDSICSNRTSTYSITAIAGSSYSWTATGGTISGSNTGNSITVLWGAAGTGSVTVKQTSDFGCDSSISKNIRIMPTPAPVISGPDSICSNRTSTYSITAIAGSSYSWTATGGTISGSNTGSSIKVLWGAAGAGSVSVTQTSGFGCDSSVSKFVQIVPTPAPVISGPDSICSNRTSTYSITAIVGSSHNWTATGGTISGSKTGSSITVLWGAAGTGSVTVKQTSDFGCDSSMSKSIRIMPTPAPVISGPDSICSNRTSTYSITAIAGSSYNWTATGGTISGSNTGNSITVLWGATGTGSVSVKQTSSFGCDSLVSKNIRIMPTPAPVISGPDSICSNRTSTYSITAIAGSTYSWTANGGTINGSKTGNSITVLWGAAGTGSVTVTQTSGFGCDSVVSKSIEIVPTPTPVISGPDSICSNRTSTYSITAIAGSTYNWTATGGTISGSNTGNSITVLWGAVGTGSVTVKQTSDFGCDSSMSKSIRIMPTPAPVISGPDSICSNRTSMYSITTIAGSSYNWTANGGTISGSNTGSSIKVLWGAAGNGSVTVKQTSAFGCDSIVSKSIEIVPTPAPVISGPDSICSNRTSTYSITAIAGSSYSWTATGGTISGSKTGSSITVLWGAAGTGSVAVKQTSDFGCDSSVSKSIRIMPTPAPVISGPDSICSNRTSTYSITAIAGSTYNWTANGGTISGSNTGNSITVMWGAAGTGIVSVKQTSSFGCDSLVSKNIRIMPTPAPVISGPDSICSNRTSTYSITAITGSSYSWTATGGTISGSNTGNSITVLWGAAGTGSVTVKQTSAFGCDSVVSKTIQIVPTPAPVIAGPDSICSNRTASYSVTAVANSSYVWQITGGTIVGTANSDAIFVLWGSTGTGEIKVRQVSEFGCDSSIALKVAIMPTPAPAIAGPDSVCETNTYTYQVAAINNSKYKWSVLNGTIIGSSIGNSVQVRWNLPGQGQLQIRQVSDFGCDSTIMMEVTIAPLPSPVITGQDVICNNKNYGYSTPFVKDHNFSWTVVGGEIIGSSTSNTVQVRWITPGFGSISVNEITEFGCGKSVKKNITVQATPVATIQGPDSICYKNLTTFYSGTTKHNKSWKAIGGKIVGFANRDSVVVQWDSADYGTIILRLSTTYGCDSTMKKTIKLLKLQDIPIEGPESMCVYKSEFFQAQGIKDVSYDWTAYGSVFVNDSTSNITELLYKTPGVYTMSLFYKHKNGCKGLAFKTVTVNELPEPEIKGSLKACAYTKGNSYSQNTYMVQNRANDSFVCTWVVVGAENINHKNNSTILVDWGAPGVYKIILHQRNLRTGCENSTELEVLVDSMPNIEIVVGDYSGCTPIHVDFEEKSGNPKFNCNWVFEDESIRGVRKVSKTYYKVGTHKVSLMVTNDFGCRDTATAEVTVYEKPYAAFNILTKGTLYIGDTATFINKSTRSVRYNWDLADGDYSQSKDTLKKYLSPGQHPVTLWAYNANGCADSVTKYVDVRVKPWIYVPNAFTPDGNGLNDNFEVQSEYITQFEILILNRWGEIIYRSNDVNFKWDGTYLGDPVPGGVYVYKIFARDYYDVAIPLKGDVTVLK